jgi:hypothetical protein
MVTNAVLLARLGPVLFVIGSALLVGQLLSRSEWAGFGLIGLGVLAVVFTDNGFQVNKGDLLILASTVVYAVVTMMSKHLLPLTGLPALMFVRNFFSAVIFFVLANVLYGFDHFAEAFYGPLWGIMLVYALVIVVIGQAAWFRGISQLSPASVARWTVMTPALAVGYAYRGSVSDIPLSYARLAAHPEVELFHADTRSILEGSAGFRAAPVTAGFMPGDFSRLDVRQAIPCTPEDFDIAFCRTLKPFPDGYLQKLVNLSERLLFVNHPAGIESQLDPGVRSRCRRRPYRTGHPHRGHGTAAAFLAEHGTVVAKRPNSCGGREVYRIETTTGGCRTDNVTQGECDYTDFSVLFTQLTEQGRQAILLMRYLPRVVKGDGRLIVVNGEIYGAYLRTSRSGHWVQNVSFGAGCDLVTPDERDSETVADTYGPYRDAGINILGYDLLQDDNREWRISEINAGNIGGLFRIEYLGVAGVTDRFVTWLVQCHVRRGKFIKHKQESENAQASYQDLG